VNTSLAATSSSATAPALLYYTPSMALCFELHLHIHVLRKLCCNVLLQKPDKSTIFTLYKYYAE
jgi:hypothetical protein